MNINLTLLAQAAVFALFIWFTAKFVWPPIVRAMDDRRKKIAAGLADAERSAKSLDEAKVQAKVEADRMVNAARAEAAQAMQQAKAALRDQVAVLAVAGAEQILKREVNAQAHAQLLNELKAKL